MAPDLPNSYDELPYPSHAYAQTHPDWLSTVGAVFGMDPPPVDRCRVLELGCSNGGNLLPMAAVLPDSTFVGIDLSERHIAEGQATIARAGLTNVELRQASILDVDESYGPFDYVICYGVFSWVPRPVQDKILEICTRHLAPNGIAFVNYNAYPGWHAFTMMREMMIYRGRDSSEPAQKVARAREFVDLLLEWGPHPEIRPFLTAFAERLRGLPDTYVFHEFFEAKNQPFYFLDFMDRARAADLQFVGDAYLAGMFNHQIAPEGARDALLEMAPTVELREQYLDFFEFRKFRQTLLCRKDIPLRRRIDPKLVRSLLFSGSFVARSEPVVVAGPQPVTFKALEIGEVTTSSPILKGALVCLQEAWPAVVPCAQLAKMAAERAGVASDDPEVADLPNRLWHLFTRKLLEIRRMPDRYRLSASERPRATALARVQAVMGHEVTNLRHRRTQLDLFPRQVLTQLDGDSDRAEIARRLQDVAPKDGKLEPYVDAALRILGQAGMLLR
jgi:SAM-dependent methyltransferase